MWDNVDEQHTLLSHDRPCLECGHALHTFLPCSDSCRCQPQLYPGALALLSPAI